MIEVNPVAALIGAVLALVSARILAIRTDRRMAIDLLYFKDVHDGVMRDFRKIVPYAADAFWHVTHNYPPSAWDEILQHKDVAQLTVQMYKGQRPQSGAELIAAADAVATKLGIARQERK